VVIKELVNFSSFLMQADKINLDTGD